MMTVNTTTQTTPKNSLPVKLPDGNMSTIYFWRQLPVEVKSSKNNPGIDSTSVLKGEIIEAKSQIFSTNPIDQVSVVPLSPKAATSTYLTNGSISFQVTVYIDTKCSPKNLNLYLTEIQSENDTTLNVYICYDGTEEVPVALYPYTFDLYVDEILQIVGGNTKHLSAKKLEYVNTYLHDIDPVTSRGTTTTVKKGMI